MKLVINEQPRTSRPLLMLARKDGHYDRPIVGAATDIRMEDMPGMTDAARAKKAMNFIIPLPPVGDQRGKYGVMNFGFLDKLITDGPELQTLMASGKYLMLPASPRDEYWELIKAPWWEFAHVMDEYGETIKAPLHPRPGEPTPEEIDERLDEFDENRGKAEVLSPLTLQKMLSGALAESYLKKLRRI